MKILTMIVILFSLPLLAKGLSQERAEARSQSLRNVKYDLFFNIGEKDAQFLGEETVSFDLLKSDKPLTIDFEDGVVKNISVNNRVVPIDYDKSVLTVAPQFLALGPNIIKISFEHTYSNVGTGLQRFKDPADGRTYIYSQFEPFDANRLYPCFDQPDLKATFKIRAEVPEKWVVISSTREKSVTNGDEKGKKLWTFPESALFSTYLISLHAGPYKKWESRSESIPLRLFARQSLAKYIPTKDWFKLTQQGLRYYQNYFHFLYPFKKYDQVVVPEFNEGAMENVAAVTFGEEYIKRGKPTDDDREELANTILHEMAHMWFGDLVTMKWWNGLWLNESFATIMASQTVNEATEFKKAWETFYASEKQWAYTEDQYVTTHPIEPSVPDTDQAFANFDGITYGKGASVLRQLFYYLGPKVSQAGIENYFRKYQFSNATLGDFMGVLESASGKNLDVWKKLWLETSGLNSLKAEYQCVDNKIKNFTLAQETAGGHSVLREHSTEIGFYLKDKDKFKGFRSEKVVYSGAKTVFPQFDNEVCPDMVFTNVGDYDYVKEKFDGRTLVSVENGISHISDSFLRMKAWTTLWEMVRDADLDVNTYAEIVFKNLADEKEFKILHYVLNSIHGRWGDSSALHYLPKETASEKEGYFKFISRFENFMWRNFEKSVPGSDLQKGWFDGYVKTVQTHFGLAPLVGLLRGKVRVKGFVLDQDRRWAAIKAINRNWPEEGRPLLLNEEIRDKTHAGREAAIVAEVIEPDLKVKENWYSRVLNSKRPLPLSDSRAALGSLLPYDHLEVRRYFIDRFFKDIETVNKEKGSDFQQAFMERFSVSLCNEESQARYTKYLSGSPQISPVLLKGLKISFQEDARCLKARVLARGK